MLGLCEIALVAPLTALEQQRWSRATDVNVGVGRGDAGVMN
jgi:hypothetical protein